MTAPPIPRPPEPLMAIQVAAKPGARSREVLVDEATVEQLQRELTLALEGIRAAKRAVADMLTPRGEHPYPPADPEAVAALAESIANDPPLCPATRDGEPCTVRGVHAWHYGADQGDGLRRMWQDDPTMSPDKADAADVLLAAAEMDSAAREPDGLDYKPMTAEARAEVPAEIAAAKAVLFPAWRIAEALHWPIMPGVKRGEVHHMAQILKRDGTAHTAPADDSHMVDCLGGGKVLLLRTWDDDWTGQEARVVNEVRHVTVAVGDPLACRRCKNAPALEDDVICAACEGAGGKPMASMCTAGFPLPDRATAAACILGEGHDDPHSTVKGRRWTGDMATAVEVCADCLLPLIDHATDAGGAWSECPTVAEPALSAAGASA